LISCHWLKEQQFRKLYFFSQCFTKSGHKYEAVAFRQNFHFLLSHLFFSFCSL